MRLRPARWPWGFPVTAREREIRAAVDAAIMETVGPGMAGLDAIRKAAADTQDDARLGRRVRAILGAVAAAQMDAELLRDDAPEAARAEAEGQA
jgi:hypothetical protein